MKDGKRREAVEEVLKVLGVRAEMEEIRKLGGEEGKGRKMLLIKLKNEAQKRKIMRRKRELKGRREKIIKDWTWKERKMKWKLEEIAREKERRKMKVWVMER